jgi:hypothetical protein
MLARVLTVCLLSTGLFALTFVLAGAKPPELPVKDAVECRDSAAQPVPIVVQGNERVGPQGGVLPTADPIPPQTLTPPPIASVASPACTAAPRMVAKVYPVADLVIPMVKTKDGKTTEDQLIKLIASTVSPESWVANGGAGTMEYHPLTLSLAVNQPPHIQEQLADLLANLRKAQDTEVAVEVRFVSVPEAFWEKSEFSVCLKKESSGKVRPAKVDASKVQFLDDAQLKRFLEAAQDDMRTCVMQAPKVTMFNGQEANVCVCDQVSLTPSVNITVEKGNVVLQPENKPFETGTRLSLLPVVSGDKKFIRLNVNAKLTSQDSDKVPLVPFTFPLPQTAKQSGGAQQEMFTEYLQVPNFTTLSLDKTFSLPDGGTALLNMGSRVHEGKESFGPPVLRQLFKNVGKFKQTERVLMLVTPRIIVADAKEARAVTAAGGFEEQEEPPSTAKKCEGCCEKCPQCCQSKAAGIVEKYYKARAEGHADEATKLAVQALAIDPMCFSKQGHAKCAECPKSNPKP